MENLALPLLLDGLTKLLDGVVLVFKGVANLVLVITNWVLVDILRLQWADWLVGVIDLLLIVAALYFFLGTAKKGTKYMLIIIGLAVGIGILFNIIN
jgi:hypothetical protein